MPAGPARPSDPRVERPSYTTRLIEVILETVVLSFAVWTLLYCLGLATQWSLWPSGWLWFVATLAILGWRGWAHVPVARASTWTAPPLRERIGEVPLRAVVIGAVGVLLVAISAGGGLIWSRHTFRDTWLALVVGMAALIVAAFDSQQFPPTPRAPEALQAVEPVAEVDPAAPRVRRPPVVQAQRSSIENYVTLEEIWLLVLVGIAGVFAAFTHLADTDDPYYLNRSVWVATHGNAAIKDTMFSPEKLTSSYGGGVPIASIESLFGVVAHMTGTFAGTITYLWVPPLAGCLAVLAMWRLVERMAPRRPLLVLTGAVFFLMLSGDSMLGNFWIPRIWQGKVLAVCFLIPLIWSYLIDAHEARTTGERRWAVGMLLACGICFFGLTPTATVLAPVMLGGILVAAILLRSRWLAAGGVAMVVGPVVSGLVVAGLSTAAVGGPDPKALSAYRSFGRVLGGQKPMIALGLLALGLAVVLARRGVAAALAGAAAFSGVLVYAPGILPLINTITGSGPILWRMLFVAPIPVFVGLLLSTPAPDFSAVPMAVRRPAVVLPIVALLAGLVLGGLPVWNHTGHGGPAMTTGKPQWKVDLVALTNVRALVRRNDDLHGTVLLPEHASAVMTGYSVKAYPVVPRGYYLSSLPESSDDEAARKLLEKVADASTHLPDEADVAAAAARLDVTLACVGTSPIKQTVLALYRGAGFGGAQLRYGSLSCVTRESSAPS